MVVVGTVMLVFLGVMMNMVKVLVIEGTKDTKDPISSRCVSLFYALYLHNGPGE